MLDALNAGPDPIRLRYDGSEDCPEARLTDGVSVYPLGARSLPAVAAALGLGADLATLTRHWTHVTAGFRHLCSSGSPDDDVHALERPIHHYLSYAFGCCRETNLLLGSLLADAGFGVRSLPSPEHFALEVTGADGRWYVDADEPHARITPGDIAVLAATGRPPYAYFGGFPAGEAVESARESFDWTWHPGDEYRLGGRRPRLIFRPLEPRDPYNLGADPYHRHAASGTRVGDGWLTLPRRLVDAGHDTWGQWTDVTVESPFVLLGADVQGLEGTGIRVTVVAADDSGTAREIVMPEGRIRLHPSRAVPLEFTLDPEGMASNWGGHARRVVLPWLDDFIVTDTHGPESPQPFTFRLFEDGRELGPRLSGPMPAGPHREAPENRAIIEGGHGRYRLYQRAHLVFSASDDTDPITNRRHYSCRVMMHPPQWSAFDVRGHYRVTFRLRHRGPLPGAARVHVRFQYNRAIVPDGLALIVEASSPGFAVSRGAPAATSPLSR